MSGQLRGQLRFNECMMPYTSWHLGGPAERYYAPHDIDDLALFLQSLPEDEPLTWIGLGSNVLISDAGLKGTVIHTLNMNFNSPKIISSANLDACSNTNINTNKNISINASLNSNADINPDINANITKGLVRAEVNIPSAKLAKFCAKNGLVGGEFFAGIPGTIGGALAMNAGAFGGETWSKVVSVEVINRRGEITTRTPNDYDIGYRLLKPKNIREEWFVAAMFRFEPGNAEQGLEHIKELLRKRNATQPIGVFSCGSVFKNPPGDYAARLIESCQLKGFAIGEAQVSTKHANFIINSGTAKSSDVYQLIQHIIATVYEKHKITLEPEVRILGF